MRAARLGLVCLLPALASCATFPSLRDAPATQAAWPRLLPIDALLAEVPAVPAVDPAAPVAARAGALRARAAALRSADLSG
ncbi:hypothetical protein [Albidovulum sp.]|jgi:hypothetical protein|uniref:hypothetical protein n=1 Tax=Albidovulum sp. TaxID=1872424 RepID=UPI003065E1F1